MSSVCWIINRRKCLFFLGLLTGANVKCLLDNQQAQMSLVFVIGLLPCANVLVFVGLLKRRQMSSVYWIINRRKCLVFIGLLSGANL